MVFKMSTEEKHETSKRGKIVVSTYDTEAERKRLEYVADKYGLLRRSVYVLPEDGSINAEEILNEFLKADTTLEIFDFSEANTTAQHKGYTIELPMDLEQATEVLTAWGYRVGGGKKFTKHVGSVQYSLKLEQTEDGNANVSVDIFSHSKDAIDFVIRDLKIKSWDLKNKSS